MLLTMVIVATILMVHMLARIKQSLLLIKSFSQKHVNRALIMNSLNFTFMHSLNISRLILKPSQIVSD